MNMGSEKDQQPNLNAPEKIARLLRKTTLFLFGLVITMCPLLTSETVGESATQVVLQFLIFLTFVFWVLAAWHEEKVAKSISSARFGKTGVSFHWLDGLVGLFFLGQLVSQAIHWEYGNHYLVRNMTWYWLSMAVLYFLARQLLQTQKRQKVFLVLTFSVALVICGQVAEQYFVSLPREAANFEKNPQLFAQQNGIDLSDSARLAQYQARLKSGLPFGTFALSNSLAAYLLPILILLIGVLLEKVFRKRSEKIGASWDLWLGGGVVFIFLFSIWATGSRSAIVSTIFGLVLVLLFLFRPMIKRVGWRLITACYGGVIGLLGLLLVTGSFGALFGLPIPKTILYRLEYWQATSQMVADHLWLGVGSGNFATFYTHYKLPQASEAVADPHNWFVEVWACGGLIALGGLVLFFGFLLAQFTRQKNDYDSDLLTKKVDKGDRQESRNEEIFLLIGGFVALLAVGLVTPLDQYNLDLSLYFFGVPLGLVGGYGSWFLLKDQKLSADLFGITLVALLLNLLIAGGIGYPGVSMALWILSAMIVSHFSTSLFRLKKWSFVVGAISSLLVFSTFIFVGYFPLVSGRYYRSVGWDAWESGQVNLAFESYKKAIAADSSHSNTYAHYGTLKVLMLNQQRVTSREKTLHELQTLFEEAERVDPLSHGLQRNLAQLC
ncbi:MAG: O-antigen ligase family protein, partial [Pirellulaceae bacterium]|nr:O-antigen ligase family protein [Pirellulaceae bacterium]